MVASSFEQTTTGDFDASTVIHNTASQLISEWKETKVLPDALQIYQLGQILSSLPSSSDVLVHQASHELLASLPAQHRSLIFHDLHQALLYVLNNESSNEDTSTTTKSVVSQALVSVAQLYTCAADFAPRVSDWPRTDLKELVAAYSSIRNITALERDALLTILSRLFWTESNDDDELRLVHLMQEQGDVWPDFVEWQDTRNDNWRDVFLQQFQGDEAQQDYLHSLLHSKEDETQSLSSMLRNINNKPAVLRRHSSLTLPSVSPEQEMQRRIQQVRQILPDLGEGFVESALSYYKGHVDQTLAALLDDDPSQLPEALRVLDRTLPRRRVETLEAAEWWSSEGQPDAAEAREITKTALRAASEKAEADAYAVDRVLRSSAHDEYADDYDDQYDSLEPFVNDEDYDAILSYNRVMKQVEQEQSFWETNRNVNRETASGTISDDSSSKYRRPDKLKGGRIPNAAQGRGSGRSGGRIEGGRGGRGPAGRGKQASQGEQSSDGNSKTASTTKPNQRKKDNMLAKRREKQKQAATKRVG